MAVLSEGDGTPASASWQTCANGSVDSGCISWWEKCVPDRFDLMEPSDVVASLRVSSQWCSVVSRSDLSDDDLARLHAASEWLSDMLVAFNELVAHRGAVDHAVFDVAPAFTSTVLDRDVVIEDFRAVVEHVRATLSDLTKATWSNELAFGGGTRVSVRDLGRHMARVAQIAGVDRQWVWQSS